MLAGKVGACETRIHLHGESVCGPLESVSKDTATSAKTHQESLILSAADISFFNEQSRQIKVFLVSLKMFYILEVSPNSILLTNHRNKWRNS